MNTATQTVRSDLVELARGLDCVRLACGQWELQQAHGLFWRVSADTFATPAMALLAIKNQRVNWDGWQAGQGA